MPSIWIDPAVAGVRLLVVGLAMTVGLALIIRATAREQSVTAGQQGKP